ncbi:MAG: TIGR03086 family protein [Acidimicrobiia bacterium]|nr:TIGR03086 family protein [Acidimicrobiia bacterium]
MPDLLGDDAVAAWENAVKAFSEGVDSPGALERDVTLPFATVPGAVVLEIAKFDLLVHAWDLAQATGQKFDPPAEVVEPAISAAQMIIAPEARNGDAFGAEVTPPADATPIQRHAAFTGRAV